MKRSRIRKIGGLLVAAALLAVRDRTPRPVLRVLVTAAASYAVVVPLKVLTDRSAPHAPWPDAVQLFTHDAGWSYPSGHVVNTLIWYPVVIALVERWLRRPLAARVRRTLLVLPVVIVFLAVTYLGYHWLTDCAAGVLLGLALDRVLRQADHASASWSGPGRSSAVAGDAGQPRQYGLDE
jgi:membrane-associated phospholipid phosphatase